MTESTVQGGQEVTVQYAVSAVGIPDEQAIRAWAELALQEAGKPCEVVVRIVDEAEITALNRQYRGKDGPTNVLSFPFEGFPDVTTGLLGDVVICAPVVAAEAVAVEPDAGKTSVIILRFLLKRPPLAQKRRSLFPG